MTAIEAIAFSDPWPARAFASLLAMDYARLLVAETDPALEVVGYCIVILAADEGEIANIAVRPAERGQGIGARLLDAALAMAATHGVRSLFLEVRASNAPAFALYTSRGFGQVGRRRGYYREPIEDALVLRWAAPATLS